MWKELVKNHRIIFQLFTYTKHSKHLKNIYICFKCSFFSVCNFRRSKSYFNLRRNTEAFLEKYAEGWRTSRIWPCRDRWVYESLLLRASYECIHSSSLYSTLQLPLHHVIFNCNVEWINEWKGYREKKLLSSAFH